MNRVNSLDKYTWPCYLLVLQHKTNKMVYAHVTKNPKQYLQDLVRRSNYAYDDQYKIIRALHYCGVKSFQCGNKKYDSYEEALAARAQLERNSPNYFTIKEPCGWVILPPRLLCTPVIVRPPHSLERRYDNIKDAIYACYKEGLLSYSGEEDTILRGYIEEMLESDTIEGIGFRYDES